LIILSIISAASTRPRLSGFFSYPISAQFHPAGPPRARLGGPEIAGHCVGRDIPPGLIASAAIPPDKPGAFPPAGTRRAFCLEMTLFLLVTLIVLCHW